MSAIIILFLILNFGISWFNAWSVGRSWAETKAMGGMARFMAWCGAIMSASGFTWCYLVILVVINNALPAGWQLPPKYTQGMFNLGYLAIILPVIGTGICITVQSWAYFWKERSFTNGAIAGWNTFADVYNIYTAVRVVPEMLSGLGNLFSSDDEDADLKDRLIGIMIALAALAILGGILTTTAIVRSTAKTVACQESLRATLAAPSRGQRERWSGQVA